MMKVEGLNCLVTGGAGFIGSHLADKLILKNCNVRVLDNLVNGKQENISHHFNNSKFEFISGSITNPTDINKAMKDIDVVFHLACLGVRHSITHPFENHRVNAEGSLMILEAAYQAKIKRFLYCSSSEVYGTANFVPMPETHPTRPCTVYGASKLAGEAYARAYHKTYNLDVVIIRPFNTFGPRSHYEGDAGEVIPKFIVRALANEPLLVFGDGSQTRDFTFVEDTAQGLISGLENDNMVGDTFNIGSNFEISIKDLAQKILKNFPIATSEISITPQRPGDVLRLFADCAKFTSLSDWRAKVPFEEGLIKTIEYFKSHPLDIQELIDNESGRNWEETIK